MQTSSAKNRKQLQERRQTEWLEGPSALLHQQMWSVQHE